MHCDRLEKSEARVPGVVPVVDVLEEESPPPQAASSVTSASVLSASFVCFMAFTCLFY
jgi:hypothetical protein